MGLLSTTVEGQTFKVTSIYIFIFSTGTNYQYLLSNSLTCLTCIFLEKPPTSPRSEC